jgi:fumarate reductase subunit D
MSRPSDHHRGGSYYAFVAHRLSGLALALFLPLHFFALGLALQGAANLDRFLVFADLPIVKAAEWTLVVLATIHVSLGIRILLIEFLDWQGLRLGWLKIGAAAAALIGVAFLLVWWI